jgi:glyoxylase-like metal-dependent hydrolase (beta-lactamase superfamily II)
MNNQQFSSTRRRFVAGTAGTFAAVAIGGRTLAQDATPVASPAATPVVEPPDMTGAAYPFQVGSFNCHAVSDGAFAGPSLVPLVFGQTSQDETDRIVAEEGIDPSQLVAQKTSIVIDTGSELVLVDTGSGAGAGPGVGLLVDNLRREGIQADDIDVVVLTHGHADHIGGTVTASGNPLFSNARYVMSQEDWNFFTDEQALLEVYPEEFAQQQFASAQMNLLPIEDVFELIDYDVEIVPGITSIAAQGHTLGHMAVQVQSDGEEFWFLGDAALHSIQLQYPEVVGLPDAQPERVIETRRTLFAQVAEAGGMAGFTHVDPFPSLGEVVAEGDVWRWKSVASDVATPES